MQRSIECKHLIPLLQHSQAFLPLLPPSIGVSAAHQSQRYLTSLALFMMDTICVFFAILKGSIVGVETKIHSVA